MQGRAARIARERIGSIHATNLCLAATSHGQECDQHADDDDEADDDKDFEAAAAAGRDLLLRHERGRERG